MVEIPDQGTSEDGTSEHGDLLLKLAELQFETGNTEAVEDIVDQLRSQRYDEPPVLLLEARLMVHSGEYHEAVELLEKSISMFAGDKDLAKQANHTLATCYRILGDSDRQLAALRRAVTADPRWIPAHEALAQALLESGQLRESLTEYELVVGSPNPSVNAQVSYARLLSRERLGKEDDNLHWTQLLNALATLESIPEAETDAAVIRAELLAAQGQHKEAVALLRRQINNDNETLLVSRKLVELLTKKQDWEQVENVLQRAGQSSGDSFTLRLERAKYLIDRYGQQATEQPQWHQLIDPPPDWDDVQRGELAVGLATLYFEIKDDPACEKCAQVVAELEMFQPKLDFYLLMFDLARRSGNTEAMDAVLARVQQFQHADPLLRIGEGVRREIEAKALPESETAQRDSLYQQALDELSQAARARPTWSRIPHLQAQIHDRWGNQELAIPYFLDAITLGARDTELISRAVLLLYEQERFRKTDEAIRKLEEQNTPLPYDLVRIASQVSMELKEFDRARDFAQRCAEESGKAEDQLWLAEICRTSEDFTAAVREYQAAIKIDPAKPDGWISLVEVLAHQRDIDKARQVIDKARELLPAEVADDTIAQCFAAINDYPKAEQHFRQALQATPSSPPLMRRAAEFYTSINKSSEAEPLLEQLVQEKSESGQEISQDDRSWARRNLALIFALQGGTENLRRAEDLIAANTNQADPTSEDKRTLAIIYGNRQDKVSREKAISLLQQAIKEQSEFSVDDHFLLAQLFNRAGDWDAYGRTMRSVLDKGGKENPKYVTYHASALVEKGELAEARNWIRRLNSLAPGAPATNALVFEWLFQSQDYARLLTVFQANAKQQDKWHASAQIAEKFGTRLMRRGDGAEAEPFLALAKQLYTQIAEADPNGKYVLKAFQARQGQFEQAFEGLSDSDISPDLLAQISQMALRSGQLSDKQARRLIALVTKAHQRNPENDALGLCVADLYSWVGSWRESTEAYQALLATRPDSIAVLNNMSAMLAMSGQRLNDARRAINRAIDINGATEVLYDTRGMVRVALGLHKLAEQDFRASTELNASVDRLFHLAQALHAQGKVEEARSVFKEAKEKGITAQSVHRQERLAFELLAAQL